ncbi:MAG: hypothetical protein U5J78_02975 [Parasphingorhabdus sp.]|nr:hypothetical protein [Parasphingorhabdus sp.]
MSLTLCKKLNCDFSCLNIWAPRKAGDRIANVGLAGVAYRF